MLDTPLRPARTPAEAKKRAQLIRNFRKFRAEVEQIFKDAASWNDNSTARKNGAPPIDVDPDGALRRILAGLDKCLGNEPQ